MPFYCKYFQYVNLYEIYPVFNSFTVKPIFARSFWIDSIYVNISFTARPEYQ